MKSCITPGRELGREQKLLNTQERRAKQISVVYSYWPSAFQLQPFLVIQNT